MNKLAVLLMLLTSSAAVPCRGQSKQPEKQSEGHTLVRNLTAYVRIYVPKHLTDAKSRQVASFVQSLSQGVTLEWSPIAQGIVIRVVQAMKGWERAAEQLDQAEALLKRFDVPEPPRAPDKQIEVTIYLVHAYGERPANVKTPVPAELEPVVKEMKGALPYTGFGLIDTIRVIAENGTSIEDALPAEATYFSPLPYFYRVSFELPSILADGKTVQISQFHFGLKVPLTTNQYHDESIQTPLTVQEGQKQVLGKLKLLGTAKDDLFIVLICRLK